MLNANAIYIALLNRNGLYMLFIYVHQECSLKQYGMWSGAVFMVRSCQWPLKCTVHPYLELIAANWEDSSSELANIWLDAWLQCQQQSARACHLSGWQSGYCVIWRVMTMLAMCFSSVDYYLCAEEDW